MEWWKQYQVDVPEGESGNCKISRFSVSEEEAKLDRIRSIMSFSHWGYGAVRAVPGNYTRLSIAGHLVMSDTPDEIRSHMGFIKEATGHVLINGLGLGMCLQAILNKADVKFVTVIELSQDVIDLVEPHYHSKFNGRFEVIQANALEYMPPKGKRYNTVWHDIWPNICSDNLPDMHKLHRKYGRRCDWQGSWNRYLCERNR